jgi:phage gpG-like protein
MPITVSITLETRGLEEAKARIESLALTPDRLRELHGRWGAQTLNWVNENFEQEGALTGTPWQRLSANTIAGRRRGSSKILQDTGTHLRNTFTMKFDETEAVVGTASEIALFHEEGTKGPYEIKPKNPDGWLVFAVAAGGARVGASLSGISSRKTWRKGQNVAFSKGVMHPGLVPRPMLPRATMQNFIDRIVKTTNNFINELINK